MTSIMDTLPPVRERSLLLVVLLTALAFRLPFILVEFMAHADEVFQYIEPSYFLTSGQGIFSWEWAAGIRSWFIPVLLAPFIWIGKLVLGESVFWLVPTRLVLVLLSILAIWSSVSVARRMSAAHALAVAVALGASFEPVFMAGRVLSDNLGAIFFVFSFPFLLQSNAPAQLRALLIGGALLGLAVASRLQLAPAAVVMALGCAYPAWRRILPMAAGGLLGIVLAGLCDLAMGHYPLAWIFENIRINVFEQRSEEYGTESWSFYVATVGRYLGAASVVLVPLFLIGARRWKVLAAVCLVNVLVHSLVPHKELRFTYLSIILFWMIAAVGSVDAVDILKRRTRLKEQHAFAFLAATLLASSATWAWHSIKDHRASQFALLAGWRDAHEMAGICGLASLDMGVTPTAYSYIDRPIPIYMFDRIEELPDLLEKRQSYNVILASEANSAALKAAGFDLQGCPQTVGERTGRTLGPRSVCLFKRPGNCDERGSEDFLENRVRQRLRI